VKLLEMIKQFIHLQIREQTNVVYSQKIYLGSQDCPPAPPCIKPTQSRLLHIRILTSSTRKEATGAYTGIHHIMRSFPAGIYAFLFDFALRQSRSTNVASYKWETIQEVTTFQ